jgi:putative ABC transport system ATP-binding protein
MLCSQQREARLSNASSDDQFINLQAVTKVYQRGKQRVPVLDGVDARVARGAFEAIMGPSGSGKTTLLNLISGIDRATSGKVSVAGVDITTRSENELADWRLRHIGFIFQFYNLVQVLTAYQNVELPLLLMRVSSKQRRERVRTALSLVDLLDREDHYPNQLSGGQEQRVGIARAIVTDPSILVADEPTGDLDADSGARILELLGQLHQQFNKTIIMVTHDPKAAAAAQTVRRVERGRLAQHQGLSPSPASA